MFPISHEESPLFELIFGYYFILYIILLFDIIIILIIYNLKLLFDYLILIYCWAINYLNIRQREIIVIYITLQSVSLLVDERAIILFFYGN